MKTVFQVVLIVAAILLAFQIYSSIRKPIDFEQERKARYDATIQRLKDIRKAELAYKDVHGKFTGSFDTLINFVNTGKLPIVRKIGMLTDSMIDAGWTEAKALKQGLIIRDTILVNVKDTIFGKDFKAEELKMVPVKDTVAQFFLGAGTVVTGSGIKVPVFEARVHNNTILKNLDKQLVINLNDQKRTNGKYPGLKVGSLTETNNNAGNWE
jgi:hypothetical protein